MTRIYGCQFDIAWEDKTENYRRVKALLGKRKLSPGSLVVLPEMFATGFSMNSRAIAEQANGPTSRFMRELAEEKGMHVLGGVVRFDSRGRIFNEATCLAPSGRRVANYAKLHLFSPGDESRHYAPGKALTIFRWGQFKVGVFICYDLRFPEIFRMAVQRGANLFVVIANWPAKREAHWTALLRARAIENQAYVVGINRCGDDPRVNYSGGSVIFNPWGEAMAEAGKNDTVLSASLDLAEVNRIRTNFPVLRDVRTRFMLKE